MKASQATPEMTEKVIADLQVKYKDSPFLSQEIEKIKVAEDKLIATKQSIDQSLKPVVQDNSVVSSKQVSIKEKSKTI